MKEKITVSVDATVMRAVRQTDLNVSEICERALQVSTSAYMSGIISGLKTEIARKKSALRSKR